MEKTAAAYDRRNMMADLATGPGLVVKKKLGKRFLFVVISRLHRRPVRAANKHQKT